MLSTWPITGENHVLKDRFWDLHTSAFQNLNCLDVVYGTHLLSWYTGILFFSQVEHVTLSTQPIFLLQRIWSTPVRLYDFLYSTRPE